MFLKEVYRHSRWLFAGFLLFAVAQLVLNAKEGMVFSPMYHFHMYGWPQKPQKAYTIPVITYQGDTLRGHKYSPQACDRLYYGLQTLHASRCDSFFYQSQVRRLFAKAHLPIPAQHRFINNQHPAERWARYKANIGNYFGMDTAQIHIAYHSYGYAGGSFIHQYRVDSLDMHNHLLCK